jgi:2-alkyl-3-oxoalkanoate reductase
LISSTPPASFGERTMSLPIGILGASGFIGSRLVDRLAVAGRVRGIVHRASRRSALRDRCETRVADACDAVQLFRAFDGCATIVHAVNGDPETIVQAATAAYVAAEAAGVRRLVYLSSAAVHGQAPAPGTDERARLRVGHPFAYNDAKIRAERHLAFRRRRGRVEVVVLRPQVVYGPRAFWVTRIATDLASGAAYLVDEGKGVCDAVHVDDVATAVQHALVAPGIDGEAFIVGGREDVRWRDFYGSLAGAVGVDLSQVARVEAPSLRSSARQRFIEPLRKSVLLYELAERAPRPARRLLDRVLGRRWSSSPSTDAPATPEPFRAPSPKGSLSPEPMLLALQSCTYKLPIAKAEARLGYRPAVSFADGMRETTDWVRG